MRKFIKDWVYPIVTAIIIAMLINRFVLFKIYVPSESMVPTIMIGDQLFVTKVYNTDNVKRGDILVFYSEEIGDLLIKRVIGLPGEKIEIKEGGSVYVNGNKLEEPYVKHNQNKTGSFNVPEGHFLFLGDNRANSKDARYWKDPYISKDEIKGKARITIFPFSRIGIVK